LGQIGRQVPDEDYVIHAIWSEEAGVFYAQSKVPGLRVEAATIAEFVEILKDVVPELLAANTAPLRKRARVRFETGLDLAFA